MSEISFPDWRNPDWYDLHHDDYLRRGAALEAFYRAAWSACPGLDDRHRVLEVGAGTGAFAAGLIERFPRCGALTLADIRAERLIKAEARLAALGYRGRLENVATGLDGVALRPDYHLIASVLAIGEFQTEAPMERRAAAETHLAPLLAGLRERLRPGGYLVWGERIDPLNDAAHGDAAPGLVTGSSALSLLGAARFEDIDCVFRCGDLALFRARRPD